MGRDVARQWLQRGQMLEAEGQFSNALAAYDAAIAVLAGVQSAHATPAQVPEHQRELGIAWMNRGNAAQKIGTLPSLAVAVRAYDKALDLFRTLPLDPSGARQNHLGAAWLNRGHALLLAADPAAIASFENAVVALTPLPTNAAPSFRRNLAGAHTNLAHVLLASDPARAGHSARAALYTVAGYESTHLDFAAMSLRARRALVMALGLQLAEAGAGKLSAELINEASDTVEAGLSLAHTLEQVGVQELRPLAERLFRLGVQLYGAHQPHFLGEFVLEVMSSPALANDKSFRGIADAALSEALAQLQRPQLVIADTAAADRLLSTAYSLRAALAELSRRT